MVTSEHNYVLTEENKMNYTDPKTVKSPKISWTLIDVLHDGGENQDALAIGEWEGERVLAARWNGFKGHPIGGPQSRGIPTWFILPVRYNELLISTLTSDKQVIARALLGIGS